MSDQDHADVVMRPPRLFLSGLTAGAVLELFIPLGPGLANGSFRAVAIGIALAIIGAALVVHAARRFSDAGTTVPISDPTTALVTDGLYGWSRNPIYVAATVFYVGLAIALTTGWALLALPVVLTVLHHGVVLREEVFLEDTFGADYVAYKSAVPRWL